MLWLEKGLCYSDEWKSVQCPTKDRNINVWCVCVHVWGVDSCVRPPCRSPSMLSNHINHRGNCLCCAVVYSCEWPVGSYRETAGADECWIVLYEHVSESAVSVKMPVRVFCMKVCLPSCGH